MQVQNVTQNQAETMASLVDKISTQVDRFLDQFIKPNQDKIVAELEKVYNLSQPDGIRVNLGRNLIGENLLSTYQRINSTNGEGKIQAVFEFVTALREYDINLLDDIFRVNNLSTEFEKTTASICDGYQKLCLNPNTSSDQKVEHAKFLAGQLISIFRSQEARRNIDTVESLQISEVSLSNLTNDYKDTLTLPLLTSSACSLANAARQLFGSKDQEIETNLLVHAVGNVSQSIGIDDGFYISMTQQFKNLLYANVMPSIEQRLINDRHDIRGNSDKDQSPLFERLLSDFPGFNEALKNDDATNLANEQLSRNNLQAVVKAIQRQQVQVSEQPASKQTVVAVSHNDIASSQEAFKSVLSKGTKYFNQGWQKCMSFIDKTGDKLQARIEMGWSQVIAQSKQLLAGIPDLFSAIPAVSTAGAASGSRQTTKSVIAESITTNLNWATLKSNTQTFFVDLYDKSRAGVQTLLNRVSKKTQSAEKFTEQLKSMYGEKYEELIKNMQDAVKLRHLLRQVDNKEIKLEPKQYESYVNQLSKLNSELERTISAIRKLYPEYTFTLPDKLKSPAERKAFINANRLLFEASVANQPPVTVNNSELYSIETFRQNILERYKDHTMTPGGRIYTYRNLKVTQAHSCNMEIRLDGQISFFANDKGLRFENKPGGQVQVLHLVEGKWQKIGQLSMAKAEKLASRFIEGKDLGIKGVVSVNKMRVPGVV